MTSVVAAEKPHAVLFPFPFQSHINPMIKLAKILHHKGFHITFVNTDHNHNRLIKSRGLDSLISIPDFQYHSISDGLPPSSDPDASQDITDIFISFEKVGLINFRNLITQLNTTSSSTKHPPVTCLVIDFSCSCCLPVAKELGIPSITFSPFNACGFTGMLLAKSIVERGLLPFKDECMDSRIDWIPGLKDMRVRDIPTYIREADVNMLLQFGIPNIERAMKASAVIINTFDAIESETLDSMKHLTPPLYTLGPLHLFENKMSSKELKSLGSNLLKEETNCIKWLDSQEPNSVLYVSFGTTSYLTSDLFNELAWGLANSKKPFLWIIRPDLVSDDSNIYFPPEFYTETKERSLLVSWCSQEQVLNHPSTGGFLTNSGWNSTLESISAGVPMICWPSFADQPTTSRYTCAHWGMGIEMNIIKRNEVEKMVKELLEGEKGKEMKRKGLEWKRKAEEAISPGGSSYTNLNKVLHEVLNFKIGSTLI